MPTTQIYIFTTTVIYSLLNLLFVYFQPPVYKQKHHHRIVHSVVSIFLANLAFWTSSSQIYIFLITESIGYHIYDLLLVIPNKLNSFHHITVILGLLFFGFNNTLPVILLTQMELTSILIKMTTHSYRNGYDETWQFNVLLGLTASAYITLRLLTPIAVIWLWWGIDHVPLVFAGIFLGMNGYWLHGFLKLILSG